MRPSLAAIACAVALLPLSAALVAAEDAAHWPQWRGPLGTGVAPQADPPTEWSETKNVRWKVAIAGRGHASPIVWGDRVYVQTAIPSDEPAAGPNTAGPATQRGSAPRPAEDAAKGTERVFRFALLALDRHTGRTVWQQTLCEAMPHERGHTDASPASNSPVTDGTHVFAYFGSRGLYCLDMQGNVIWKKQLGEMQTRRGFGEGSSPALHDDTIVLAWDQEQGSFITALDKRTGTQRWRMERDEPTSWSTPLIVFADGIPQVIASATKRIRSYDLTTGRLLWECAGMTENVIATPVSGQGLVFCGSGCRGSALVAVRYAEAQGDVTGSPAVAWKYEGKGAPYVPSPLLYGDELYFLQENRAALSCVDAKSGRPHYAMERLEGLRDVYASLVGAAGRIYVVSRDGKTAVVQTGSDFQVLGVNALDDHFTASPALADHELYLRGQTHLYCIAKD